MLAPRGLYAKLEPREARAARDELRTITRVITESPVLLAREQQVFARYADSLANLLAAETGAGADTVEPRVTAHALVGVHRALIGFVRKRVLAEDDDRPRLARDLRAQTIEAFARLEEGWGAYAPRKGETALTGSAGIVWRSCSPGSAPPWSVCPNRMGPSPRRAGSTGPFWDGVHGRAPVPRAAATLGFRFIDADVEQGTIELSFEATEDFTNPSGNVLGAFVAAMLYDTVGPALLATLEPDQFQSTLELGVHFLRPVRPGTVIGKGRIVHRDGDLVFLEASLIDADGATIATATATSRVIPLDQARSAV